MISLNVLYLLVLTGTGTFLATYYFILKPIKVLKVKKRIWKNGILTTAEIIDVKKTRDESGYNFYHKILRYQTLDGKVIIAPGEVGSGVEARIGKRLEIQYLRESPEQCAEKDTLPWYYLLMILFGFLVIFGCIAAFIVNIFP